MQEGTDQCSVTLFYQSKVTEKQVKAPEGAAEHTCWREPDNLEEEWTSWDPGLLDKGCSCDCFCSSTHNLTVEKGIGKDLRALGTILLSLLGNNRTTPKYL